MQIYKQLDTRWAKEHLFNCQIQGRFSMLIPMGHDKWLHVQAEKSRERPSHVYVKKKFNLPGNKQNELKTKAESMLLEPTHHATRHY